MVEEEKNAGVWVGRVTSKKPKVEPEAQAEYSPFGESAKDMFDSLFGKNEELDAEIINLESELNDVTQNLMDEIAKDVEHAKKEAKEKANKTLADAE